MPFLTVDGFTLPIAEMAEVSYSRDELGRRERGHRGEPHKRVRSLHKSWRMSTVPKPEAETIAYAQLLNGLGHVFNFEGSLRSETSLRLSPSSSQNVTLDVGGGFFDDALVVGSGLTAEIPAQFLGRWYVQCRLDRGSGFDILAEDDEGNQWLNGATTSVTNTWFSVDGSDGAVQLEAATYDAILLAPWRPTSAMALAWTGSALPFSPLPRLRTGGDFGEYVVEPTAGKITHEDAIGYAPHTSLNFELSTYDDPEAS